MRAVLCLLVVGMMSGCVFRVRPPRGEPSPPPPPPIPSSPRMMTYDDAVAEGARYAAGRGYSASLKEAELEDDGRRWELEYAVAAGDARGELKLVYDAHTWSLIKAKEELERRKAKRKKHHDDDDDEDEDEDDDDDD